MSLTPILLADPSPNLRYLTLKNLLNQPDEAQELEKTRHQDPLIRNLIQLQQPDGSWSTGSMEGNAPRGDIQLTAQALTRLGYLQIDHPSIQKGAEYLYGHQQPDGSWPLGNYESSPERQGYDIMSLQTSIPLRALAICGYATDPRSEKAYNWLNQQRLDDGTWPTGTAQGVYGYVAGYRRLPHSRWGCRSNTTAALESLALHPERRKSSEAARAFDVLIGRETRERHNMGFDIARTIGAEKSTGFLIYYARFDMAQMLDLSWKIGATVEDPRVNDLVEYVKSLQGQYGLWEYSPQPQASRWVTYSILYSLTRLSGDSDWVGLEPRTPFQTYPRRRKRF